MYVQVEITLSVKPTAVHEDEMRMAAYSRTNDKKSVQILVPKNSDRKIIAFFTIEKARQIDVVDRIGKAFHMVNDYSDSSIWFPTKALKVK